MDIRYAVSPGEAKRFGTKELREAFLINDIFNDDEISMVYSHVDRIITGGAKPVTKALAFEAGKEIGADSFLERRELGLINIGGEGKIIVDGTEYALKTRDGLYIGQGARDIILTSSEAMLTIFPPPPCLMNCLAAAWQRKKTLFRLTLIVSSQSFSVYSTEGLRRIIPALLIKMSSRPNSETVFSTIIEIGSMVIRFALMAIKRRPICSTFCFSTSGVWVL